MITRQEMIQALTKIQNHPFYHNVDILTITGFMNDEEVLRHAASCKNATFKHDEKAA